MAPLRGRFCRPVGDIFRKGASILDPGTRRAATVNSAQLPKTVDAMPPGGRACDWWRVSWVRGYGRTADAILEAAGKATHVDVSLQIEPDSSGGNHPADRRQSSPAGAPHVAWPFGNRDLVSDP